MTISSLHIHSLRNIMSARLSLNPCCNVFCGPNGSGKTALLEALYLLGTGKSFKTHDLSSLINVDSLSVNVYGSDLANNTFGFHKARSQPIKVKINDQICATRSELAKSLPCQVIFHDLFDLVDAGPSVRRRLLDWGLFHVKPSYHNAWKEYFRVLKQRNALLRQQASRVAFEPWNLLLVNLAQELDNYRKEYMILLTTNFQFFLKQLTDMSCELIYYKGWDKRDEGYSLTSILNNQFDRDQYTQYTHSGAHQADILFESNQYKVKQMFSRGQQKIMLIALRLAQAHLLSVHCMYLFDDLMSELDAQAIERITACFRQVKGQFFLTTTAESSVNSLRFSDSNALFILKNGCISE